MPTGYTGPVMDGHVTELQEFAVNCAREFSHTYEGREGLRQGVEDHPNLVRNREIIAEADQMIEAATGWTEEEADEQARLENQRTLKEFLQSQRRRRTEKQRLETMKSKVEQFQPPTAEHAGLATYMISQLDLTIEKDTQNYGYQFYPQRHTGESFREQQIRRANWVREYAQEAIDQHTAPVERDSSFIDTLIVAIGETEFTEPEPRVLP